jgi:hypothetical protein
MEDSQIEGMSVTLGTEHHSTISMISAVDEQSAMRVIMDSRLPSEIE